MTRLSLLILVPTFLVVSLTHYAGFLAGEWLHLYVFEPAEVRLARLIGRVW